MAENVAARARLVELDPRHLRMVELARELGAAANYAGSGGAIVGVVPAGTPIDELRDSIRRRGLRAARGNAGGRRFFRLTAVLL